MRHRNHRHRRTLSVLGIVVVLATALALMVPAISMTWNGAPQGSLVAGNTALSGYPSQTFQQDVKDAYGNTIVSVKVEAPEGALSANTTMEVKKVTDTEILDAAKAKAVDSTDMAEGSTRALAFDIAFINSAGDEVEPLRDVSVTLATRAVAVQDQMAVVHVGDDNNAEVMPVQMVDAEDEQVEFTANKFSVYAIVYTVDFAYGIDGKVYNFSLLGGDSISLNELVEKLDIANDDPETEENELATFVDEVENVEFSNPEYLDVTKYSKDAMVYEVMEEKGLHATYPLGLTEQEVLAINHKEYAKGQWVLLSLKPFSSDEALTVQMFDGESFVINVADAQDAVLNPDGTVQTITNPSGTTIDLFDYWVVDQGTVGRDAWGDLNQSWGRHPDSDGLNGSGNNKGINASGSDPEHGHALKFSPAWEGTVFNGSKVGDSGSTWSSLNSNGRGGLNSYTGNGNPFQGIITGTLVDGYPQLSGNNTIGSTSESLAYLFDPTVAHSGKESFTGTDKLLYVDKEGYYTYDSRDYAANFDKGSKTYTLTGQTSGNSEIRGFWPFGIQNFWLGMHMNTQFSMPANGQVLNPVGEYKDMQFEFSGDDDTWLYVDGVLVGDGGGIHNRTEIDINFATGKVTVTGKKDSIHPGNFEEVRYLDDIFKAAGRYNADDWEPIPGDPGHTRFKANTYHTFDMFYLERGGGESNLYIHYNLVSTADFTAHKSYMGADPSDPLKRDQFQFELIGLDGQYQSVWNPETQTAEVSLVNENGQAIMPTSGMPGGDGSVANPKKVREDSEKRWVYTTSVTEDGNVNFGTAEISQDEMNLCDQGRPSLYRYIVREIVPGDAKNADGVSWAQATDEQKKAGGFVKDQITYDGTTYYMTARVTSWDETGPDGKTYKRYGLSKTYYTDESFETVDPETTFIHFDNRFTPAYGKVEFTKTDSSGHPLEGAKFALYKDEACTVPAVSVDAENEADRVAFISTSGVDGLVQFGENPNKPLRIGTYYMKEIEAPSGYKLNSNVYRVSIVDMRDTQQESIIVANEDDAAIPVTQIRNVKSSAEGLEIDKQWKDASGKVVEPADDLAIKYDLYQIEETSEVGKYALDVSGLGYGKPEWSAAKNFSNDDLLGVKNGIKKGSIVEIAITTTSYPAHENIWSFDTLDQRTKISSNQLIVSNNLLTFENGQIRKRVIQIEVTDDSSNEIILTGDLESCYEGNGGKPTISASIVSEPDPIPGSEARVATVTVNKDSVSYEIDGPFKELDPAINISPGDANWTSVVKNLPSESIDEEQIKTYKYRVVEDEETIPDEYVLEGVWPNLASADEVIVISNKSKEIPRVDIKVIKLNAAKTQNLSGAEFKLTQVDADGNPIQDGIELEAETNSDGELVFGKLIAGRYRLEETVAPAGYVNTEAVHFINVTLSGDDSVEGSSKVISYQKAETGEHLYTVLNEPGKPLPNTGGPGVLNWKLPGTLLILVAITLLGFGERNRFVQRICKVKSGLSIGGGSDGK